ncbi:hypothetical protein [Streptomyces sp. NPDC054834]
MTDTVLPPLPPAPPSALSPRDEARVSFALCAKKLGDLAYDLLPLDPDAAPGDRLRRALALRERLDTLIEQAAVAEREEGASWTQLGTAAGITKQAAHERWSPHTGAWAAAGRMALRGSSGLTALDAAMAVDAAYARQDPEHAADAFSSGLDAVRFPGAEAAERARRERAAAIRDRLDDLDAEIRLLHARFRTVTTDGAAPAARAPLLHRRADVHDEAARLLEELGRLEPDQATDHRARAEEHRHATVADREFAGLLDPQDTITAP